ncbi:MAG: iron-containing redox enzyme family protein [Myxococcales bacterium]|nr:iron-containing redox enzyme family protein [Myxococcales bacterium]
MNPIVEKVIQRAARVTGGASERDAIDPWLAKDVPFEGDPRVFLQALDAEIATHEAVSHPLLARLSHVPFTRDDYRTFGLQHYALVGTFTTYLELLLLRAPNSDAKSWIAKVLVDEYGEGSEGKDHAELYREYLRATGARAGDELTTPLHVDVTGFVREHLRICREEPFLVGLGAVGPGHEWAIPRMFQHILRGLRRARFADEELRYFALHVLQDEDHGAWLEEALATLATTPEAQRQIRRGAMLSLAARARFWSAVEDKIVRFRQPNNVHLRTEDRRVAYSEDNELTLEAWRAVIARDGLAGIAATVPKQTRPASSLREAFAMLLGGS